ncbi:MAG TPA: hypothetical protein VF144_17250 [Chitinophagaceae bacterium]
MKNNVAYLPKTGLRITESYAPVEPVNSPLQAYSQEIISNLRQVLSLARLQLMSISVKVNPSFKKNPGHLVGGVVTNLEEMEKRFSFEDIEKNGFANSMIIKLKRLAEAGFCIMEYSVKGKFIRLGAIKELAVFCILQQLIYPCLNIFEPAALLLSVHYEKSRIGIELTRTRNQKPLILDIEELVKLKQRLKPIGGKISYKGQCWNTLIMDITSG